MPIISIIKLMLTLVSTLAQYAQNKQLMDAGAAEAVLQGIQDANTAIDKAKSARANANSLPVSSDPQNRDNEGGV